MTKAVALSCLMALVAFASACSQSAIPEQDVAPVDTSQANGGSTAVDGVDAGPAASSQPPSDVSRIYSGNVWLSAPGFSGGPVDQMTVVLDGQSRVRYFDFNDFTTERSFGDEAGDFPLLGTRDTVVGPLTAYTYHVVVEQADRSATSLEFRYSATGLDGTPGTDFAEGLSGTLADQTLSVTYSIIGTLLTAPIDAHAEGVLSLSSS